MLLVKPSSLYRFASIAIKLSLCLAIALGGVAQIALSQSGFSVSVSGTLPMEAPVEEVPASEEAPTQGPLNELPSHSSATEFALEQKMKRQLRKQARASSECKVRLQSTTYHQRPLAISSVLQLRNGCGAYLRC